MSTPVRHGFLLLEAAVALLMIGLVAGGALELYAAETRAARREPARIVATALAQDRLAAVRLLDARQLGRLPDSLARGRFAPPFEGFRWRTSVRRTGESDLYELHVAIDWADGTLAEATQAFVPPSGAAR